MQTTATPSCNHAINNRSKGPYRICTNCVMDTSDPDIYFDDKGVCNHCISFFEKKTWRMESEDEGVRLFDNIISKIKQVGSNCEYDCVTGISGGADSTYVTYLAKRYGLRVLAVHLDNGWNSELAVHNIEQALKKLNVDLYTHVIDWDEFRDLQLSFLKGATPDCELPTDHAIFGLLMRVANKHGIRYVLTGMNFSTESTNVPKWTYSPSDWSYIKGVHKRFSSTKLTTYPYFSIPYLFYTFIIKRVKFVSPLNYLSYDRKKAISEMQQELDWRDYGGKHHESVYTRFFQSYILPKKFGIDKRRAHLSDQIKVGKLTRNEAIDLLELPHYDIKLMEDDKAFVLKKFGLSDSEFSDIMQSKNLTYKDYPNHSEFITALKSLQHWLRKIRFLHK